MTRLDPTTPAVAAATLVIETPGGAIDPRPLTRDELTIGRDARCDIHLDHPTISRLHGRLWRDAVGWHFQDLGSQNGSRVNAAFLATPATLADGAELHVGRIRAWFFGSGGVPESWRPRDEDAEHAGRLVRCRCGNIAWAPDHAAGMRLPCARCGRDLVIRDRSAPPPATRATVECAACHTSIGPDEAMTTCPECGTQMHTDCWRENVGCATYGCSQVNAAEPPQPSTSVPPNPSPAGLTAGDAIDDVQGTSSATLPLYAAQTILLAIVGLPLFGVPAIAYGTYRAIAADDSQPTAKRVGYAIASYLAGACGFIASAYWWLGGIG